MLKRRRAETHVSGQATSPKPGPKTRTRVHALQQPARRRTAPRWGLALRPQPRILPSSSPGLVTRHKLGLCSCLIRVLQPLVSRAWQAIGEEMDTSTVCVKSIVESWRNHVAQAVGECC